MQMLSGCPEEYELDGNLFPFMNPLIIIVWKACGTQKNERALHIYLFILFLGGKLSAICWIFSSFIRDMMNGRRDPL